jgi:predicted metal-dependent hydrolase
MNADISAMVERFEGQEFDAHYLAFFECFNRGLFFEAHEVLEKIWLPQRKATNGAFYKGLIQLAGAFVHLQKNRLHPAGSLLELARANLERYDPTHDGLDVKSVLELIKGWLDELSRGKFVENPLKSSRPWAIKLTCVK